MNDNNIFISTDELNSKIEQIKVECEKMKMILEQITQDANGLNNYWKGNTGEKAYECFNNYVKKYIVAVKKIDNYKKFLEEASNAYIYLDNIIKEKFDETMGD